MNEKAEGEPKPSEGAKPTSEPVRDQSRLFLAIGIGAVLGGAIVYFWLMTAGAPLDDQPRRFELFASLGDAMAPFAAILSAAALFAAIDGVRLQRIEFQKGLDFMAEQAKSAKASEALQARLADAQAALARRQYEANVRAHYAQIVELNVEISRVESLRAENVFRGSGHRASFNTALDKVCADLVELRDSYRNDAGGVVGVLHVDGAIAKSGVGEFELEIKDPDEKP